MLVPYLPWFQTSQSRHAQISSEPVDEVVEEIDSDGDLLIDRDEREITFTDPNNPDTDGDGIGDGEEYEYWNDRYDKARDGELPDWLTDRRPYLAKEEGWGLYQSGGDLDDDGETNINDKDSDNDGLPDSYEIENGLDPADPNSNFNDLDESIKRYIALRNFNNNKAIIFNDELGLSDDFYDDGFKYSDFDDVMFRVTPASQPRYWRSWVFDKYSNGKWSQSHHTRPQDTYTGQELKDEVTFFESRESVTHKITIQGVFKGVLPTALHTTGLFDTTPDTEIIYNEIGVFSTSTFIKSYSFNSTIYTYNPSQLKAASVPVNVPNKYLVDDDDIDYQIKNKGLDIAKDKGSDFEKIYAIAKHLTTEYIYDLNSYEFNSEYQAPGAVYSGSTNDRILQNMLFHTYRGRCIDFASAFVLMCRANGIPAQLALGYAPGDIEDPNANERIVRVGHKHSWGEVLLDGVGWLPVETTPARSLYGNTTGTHVSGEDTNILTIPADAKNGSIDYNFGGEGGDSATHVYIDLLEVINDPKLDSDLDGTKNIDDDDDDNDGLSDLEEIAYRTNPFRKDTDRDGLTDYEEVKEHGTSPLKSDTDNDGLTDYYEVKDSGTNPLKYDTDSGGAHDGLEVVNSGDPWDPEDDDNYIDSDFDGLSNAFEAELGTDPNDYDTDDGGASDGQEYYADLNSEDKVFDPIENSDDDLQLLDSDNDGLMDYKELVLGSDRFDPDTDNGGVSDGVEYSYDQLLDYDFSLLNSSDDHLLMDDDSDDLINILEDMYGTDPDMPDSDWGGVDDGLEVKFGKDPLDPSDDDEIDTDGDGVMDLDEKREGTDPFNIDTDNDGLTDYEELAIYYTNPTLEDSDFDGLKDGFEVEIGTDPTKRDSDGDGLIDADEIQWLTDPYDVDTDNDGLWDGKEIQFGSYPTLKDSDGDGLSDSLEFKYGTSPIKWDTDGDGFMDGDEIDFGTSPTDESTWPTGDGVDSNGHIKPNLDPVQPPTDSPGYNPDIHDNPLTDPDLPDNSGSSGLDTPTSGEGLSNILPVIVGIILVVIIVLYYISWRKQHIEEIADIAEHTEERLSKIEEKELDDIRKAIYDAYRSMLKIMRKYDFVREKSMTPLEFEKVIGAALPISNKNLSELTRIFEEARYSDHVLDHHIRDRAINCFRELKLELRGMRWRNGNKNIQTEQESVPST
jgi:transglutaminase-like putative cysteine protease